MEQITLNAETRNKVGTRASGQLRMRDLIPAVLCDKSTAHHLAVHRKDFEKALKKGARILDLNYSGGKAKVLLKEVQYDHLGEDILHVDFVRVALDERLTLEVPLMLKGKPMGVVEEGGVLDQYVKVLKISCLPTHIPAQIEMDTSHLKLDQNMKIKDVKPPEGVQLLQDLEIVVAAVTIHEIEVAAPVAAEPGPAEPELIKKEVKEEEVAEEPGKAAKEKEKPTKEAKESK